MSERTSAGGRKARGRRTSLTLQAGLGLATLIGLAAPDVVSAETQVDGFVAVRATRVESRPSWLSGGFGRLDLGGPAPEESTGETIGQAQLAIDWSPSEIFGLYLHGVARAEPSEHGGRLGGLFEAYAYAGWDVARDDHIQARLGLLLPPTSRENVRPGWSSPYTLTLSAINTWIAEELRLSGLMIDYFATIGVDELRFSASAFGGNDTAGSLLAWRGWTFGDRLTVAGEFVPLPPLDSLTTGAFRVQRDDGTRPIGDDLDDRLGWLVHGRWERPGRATVAYTHYDNRGDKALHQGEYAWHTRFDLLGLTWQPSAAWTLVGEWLVGDTGMGDPRVEHVLADLRSSYLLASWHDGPWRLSVRWDRFEVDDLDRSAAENNDESGEAWTVAAFWQPREHWRFGLQVLDVQGRRPAAAESGFDDRSDGRSLSLEVRFEF